VCWHSASCSWGKFWQVLLVWAWKDVRLVGFEEVHTEASMEMAVFRVVALRSVAEVYRRFRGACYVEHRGLSCWWWSQTTRRCNPEDSRLQRYDHLERGLQAVVWMVNSFLFLRFIYLMNKSWLVSHGTWGWWPGRNSVVTTSILPVDSGAASG
jgi:hypothetical protein